MKWLDAYIRGSRRKTQSVYVWYQPTLYFRAESGKPNTDAGSAGHHLASPQPTPF
ncbi:hypothetical protein PISMIDRAFT_679082 [Pisolithus microcarpus 441]|uniref:Uncharacterized protein n=1 Tax=Pisolithus microcarpus 441 TaxID=765257 RepID=A0A0C9ZCH9_9AGAM|nr:hypothetical protein PISMIDRAFT_679082 [Pisolithus microcarpus 441]